MGRPSERTGLNGLRRAFDEVRFGHERTLNLRESLPTADEAARRTELWLRQQQVERADEVLIITGRGNNSAGGVSPVRDAVIRTLHALRRPGIVAGHEEHTPGSFVVTVATVQAREAASRARDRAQAEAAKAPAPPAPPSLADLDDETRIHLRNLAERALEGLGIKDTATYLEGEMLQQFGRIAATIGDAPGRERRLRAAVRAALDQYE